jgi:hypothetical protein
VHVDIDESGDSCYGLSVHGSGYAADHPVVPEAEMVSGSGDDMV